MLGVITGLGFIALPGILAVPSQSSDRKAAVEEGESKLEARRENKADIGRYARSHNWIRVHRTSRYPSSPLPIFPVNKNDGHKFDLRNNDHRIQSKCNRATREQYEDSDANRDHNNAGSPPLPRVSHNSSCSNPLVADFDTGFKAYEKGSREGVRKGFFPKLALKISSLERMTQA